MPERERESQAVGEARQGIGIPVKTVCTGTRMAKAIQSLRRLTVEEPTLFPALLKKREFMDQQRAVRRAAISPA